ncbi:FAD-dependent oxidoreductase [Mycobacterium sp. OTB74]|uniref:FAD-dependent oxidoreductase n=1 Tax=Mycobacterium sp. OTB74 TaxID=1853452 RepID=UPI00247506A1|nr:FAD-dependent oxidoreductase [Mycobacterium sp. OTB74]
MNQRKASPVVAILGGGVAGMSAAHELAERGFRVTVYEANNTQGGKARSIFVPGTATPGRRGLPGEHGFRFFPSFYRHLPDTMRRIPFGQNPNGVFDNLVGTDRTRVLKTDGQGFDMVTHFPRSLDDIRAMHPNAWYGKMGIPIEDTREFLRCALQFMTSCKERRLAEYEDVTYWDFLGCDQRHPNFQLYFGEVAVQALVAMQPRVASARTTVSVGLQLWIDHMKRGTRVARVLNGPTHDAWLDPWLQYLFERGVDFRFDSRAVKLDCESGLITGARLANGGVVHADYYVAAVPAERMTLLVDENIAAADPALSKIARLTTEWMTGAQLFMRLDVPLAPGHVIFLHAPWALTCVSHPQYWAPGTMRSFGDGRAEGLLSICLSDWSKPGTFVKKPARACTVDEIRHEIWEQVKAHVAASGQRALADDDLLHFYLADSVTPDEDGRLTNQEPLLVNTVGSWWNRPEATTRISNLMLAADYVRTHTDIATMEGANEAARRAVNAIIQDSGSTAAPCAIWPLNEPGIFAPQRKFDELCFRRGLPHILTPMLGSTPGVKKPTPPVATMPSNAGPAHDGELEVDVLVIGAGPAGASTALNLLRKDASWANRIVMVDRAELPRHKLCGGAVTHLGAKVLTRMGLSFDVPHVPVREVRVVYGGEACTFRGNPVLRISRREVFDHWLVKKAEDAGVRVRQGEKVTALVQHRDYVHVTTDRGAFRARVVVAADGSKSTVRRLLGLRDANHVARLLEVLTPEPEGTPEFRDGVAVFEFGRVTTGLAGYYWDFPSMIAGQPVMNRGVYDGLSRKQLEGAALRASLSSSLESRGLDLEELELKGHPIRTFNPGGPLSVQRVLLAGDAAGVDPLYGEGISFALGYGEAAADAIHAAFERGQFDFKDYARLVRRHPLLGQLPVRAQVAKLGKHVKDPRAIAFLWKVGAHALKQTRWNDGDFNPAAADHWLLRA